MSTPLLAIDPGKDKCGLAVVSLAGEVLQRQIIATSQMPQVLPDWLQRYEIEQIIIGDSTTSKAMRATLSTVAAGVEVISVEEKNSTLEARELYWRENPPRGWRRVLPLSLQEPPEPVDDFAAIVLAQRFLAGAKTKTQTENASNLEL